MRLMIVSDIHGSAYATAKMLDAHVRHAPDRLILLGDILYHGPRNALPAEYNPPEVAQMLHSIKDKLLCVRGNCDSEVDQMVLDFPIMADYMIWYDNGRMVFTTHGHVYNQSQLPPLCPGDILLHGHTHVPAAEKTSWGAYLNPGSVSIPKEGWPSSFMIYDDGVFRVHNLETDDVLLELALTDA